MGITIDSITHECMALRVLSQAKQAVESIYPRAVDCIGLGGVTGDTEQHYKFHRCQYDFVL